MIDTRPDYPPEYDAPEICLVCGAHENACDCPECPECAAVGDPECYTAGHLEPAPDSIASLIEHIGCGSTLAENFRAVERHSSPMLGVWVILRDGSRYGSPETDNREALDRIATHTRIDRIGVSGIAWDGSDWEWYSDAPAGHGWASLDRLQAEFAEALEAWDAESEADSD